MRRAKKEVQNETEKEVKTMFEVDRIFKTNTDNNLKAFVDIKVANAVLIKGIRVLSNKEGGLFVSIPSQQPQHHPPAPPKKTAGQHVAFAPFPIS